jgi:flagellar basal-body rod protein FlgC
MPVLRISAQGMTAQQKFLEVISQNIANAQTTRTPDGGPYQRQVATSAVDPETGEVSVSVGPDSRPGRLVYDPGHPDASAEGFVQYPNIEIETELTDLLVARRVHEANATVFQAAKLMMKKALDI